MIGRTNDGRTNDGRTNDGRTNDSAPGIGKGTPLPLGKKIFDFGTSLNAF